MISFYFQFSRVSTTIFRLENMITHKSIVSSLSKPPYIITYAKTRTIKTKLLVGCPSNYVRQTMSRQTTVGGDSDRQKWIEDNRRKSKVKGNKHIRKFIV